MKSFRSALALRVTIQALALAVVLLVGATFLLRANLLSSIDASLIQSAEIQAEAGAGASIADFRFPAQELAAAEREGGGPLFPWAQALALDGKPAARSANLAGTL